MINKDHTHSWQRLYRFHALYSMCMKSLILLALIAVDSIIMVSHSISGIYSVFSLKFSRTFNHFLRNNQNNLFNRTSITDQKG